MIGGVASVAIQGQPSAVIKNSSGKGIKLNMTTSPDSKVRVQATASAGPGKGLKIDIKA